MIYQQHMYTKLFNPADNCRQYYNQLKLLQHFLNSVCFYPFDFQVPYFKRFQVILLFVLLKVRNSILSVNQIYFFFLLYLHINVLKDYQYFLHAFLRYIPNNLEYLIENMIHQVIETLHFMPELAFKTYYFCLKYLQFSVPCKNL